ncbi:MAG: hypothetical protein WDN06_18795 [Asticcacaulis sp.]
MSPTGQADAPASPWGYSSSMPQESDLVKKVLGGHGFIDPNAVTPPMSSVRRPTTPSCSPCTRAERAGRPGGQGPGQDPVRPGP